MLLDILSEVIDRESDMQIVGGSPDSDSLADRIRRLSPDVLIVGLEDREVPTLFGEVLSRFPHVKVLTVGGRAKHVTLYELRPSRTVFGEVSPAELVACIRQAVQPMEIVTRAPCGDSGSTSAEGVGPDLRLTLTREEVR